MAALRQQSYGLSGAQINKNNKNQSLYLVKLTDTAIRTLETYQNLKTSLSNQPAICFEENQGYMKIPAPTPDSPDAMRIFRFTLSSAGKETPQSSFDCIRQEGRDHLESKGSILDKITVCATDDSYQTARERMSQAEKDTWSRSAIEIKLGPSKREEVQGKQHLMPGSGSSSNNKLLCNNRSQVLSPVARFPLRDRVIHLLALKPRKKPELRLWLARERGSPKDRAELTSVLEEVSNWNQEESSYSLKPELFKHVQRDWPGYLGEEKQLIHRILSRKRPSHSDLPNDLNPKKRRSSVQPVPLQTASHGVQCTNPTRTSFHGTSGNPAYLHKGQKGEKPAGNLTPRTPLSDYGKKYDTITTPEQRQKYEDVFDAEYDEYQEIHHRIAAASRMFLQLSSQLDTLSPGTEDYKRMQDRVLEKYRKYQESFPRYREEKKRCVHLRHKLAHIKERIEEYDQGQETRV